MYCQANIFPVGGAMSTYMMNIQCVLTCNGRFFIKDHIKNRLRTSHHLRFRLSDIIQPLHILLRKSIFYMKFGKTVADVCLRTAPIIRIDAVLLSAILQIKGYKAGWRIPSFVLTSMTRNRQPRLTLLEPPKCNVASLECSCERACVYLIKERDTKSPLFLPLVLDIECLCYSGYSEIWICCNWHMLWWN